MEEFLKKEWYLFSGLMRSQVRDMKGLMTEKGLELVKEWDHEMTWYTLLVKNTGMRLDCQYVKTQLLKG